MTGAMKLQSDDGPRSSLSIRPGSHDAMGSRRSSLGDSPKGSGSSSGTLREIAGRRPKDSSQECRKTRRKNAGGCRIGGSKPSVSSGCTIVAQAFGRLTYPGSTDEPPIPRNLGTLGG
ncbi:hypothetical protein GW17_00014791 [Ensete ventricosum]|nr:hypothetical protein GW17_00014791 [Ensete ventricosum]